MPMTTRSGKRIRESHSEKDFIARNVKDERIRVLRLQKNATNFGDTINVNCIYEQSRSIEHTVASKRTLTNKNVNVLKSNPVSRSSKITHSKKRKRKNVSKRNNEKVEYKMTPDSKKKLHSMSVYNTCVDSQHNCDHVVNVNTPNTLAVFDQQLFAYQNEYPNENNFTVNGVKLNEMSCEEPFHFASNTYSLNKKNEDKVSIEKELLHTDNCKRLTCSPKCNITFDLSNEESFLCVTNIVNTTYDKTGAEMQCVEGECLNKTFEKTEHKAILNSLGNKEMALQLENQHQTFNTPMTCLAKGKSESVDQNGVDSTLRASLIREGTFTKENKICLQQVEPASCVTSNNVTLHSTSNSARFTEKANTTANPYETPSATLVGDLLEESSSRRKRSRTEGATLHTPLLHTLHKSLVTTSAAGKESGTKPSMRTQLPDFAALHRRQFARMESLGECQRRRALRAQRLLQARPAHTPGDPQRKRAPATSPADSYNRFGYKNKTQPTTAAAGAGTRSVQEARTQAVQEGHARAVVQEACMRAVQETRTRSVQEARTRAVQEARTRAVQEVPTRALQEARTRSVQEARTRLVQEARTRAVQEARTRAMQETRTRAVTGVHTRAVHEARTRSRSLLQGVRTNRRFELLMKVRRGAP